MKWKSTAIVSGVGLLLVWLGISRPAQAPVPRRATVAAATTHLAPDIQAQAERLRSRGRENAVYQAPSRDPFQFGSGPPPAALETGSTAALPAAPAIGPVVPAVTLSGLAFDTVDGRAQRTAILHTASGLVFAHEGDTVAGQYRVDSIQEDSVDLFRMDDGSTLRLR